jgi:hypothetical protein
MVTVGHLEDAEGGIDDKGRYWRKDKNIFPKDANDPARLSFPWRLAGKQVSSGN